ncbi:hypothetical protein AGMMS50249_0980 [candidate division SR1 bacterium]|nr:hypothetical protein AGMMS50249_0980 [candidate division SR1 bacterium]
MSFTYFLTVLYSISGVISIIAYLPTIDDLLKGIPSANMTTYSLRFLYYLVSVIYGVFVIYDLAFLFVTCLDALILLFICILILRVKHAHRRKQTKRNH